MRKSADVKTANIYGPKITQTPTLSDLEIKEKKVTGVYEGNSNTPLASLKALAVSDALNKSNADVLVEARYTVTRKSSRTDIVVIGYPATYNNFRPMEEADSTLVQYSMRQYSTGQVNKVADTSSKKQGKSKKLFRTLIIVPLLILVTSLTGMSAAL